MLGWTVAAFLHFDWRSLWLCNQAAALVNCPDQLVKHRKNSAFSKGKPLALEE